MIIFAGGLNNETPGSVSAIYVSKYNRFVDNILGKINKILDTKYNPVMVKLTNPKIANKSNKTKKKKKKTKTKKTGREEITNDVVSYS